MSNTTSDSDLSFVTQGRDTLRGDVPHEDELVALAEAIHDGDENTIKSARERVQRELGDEAMVDAVAVVAHFDAITRVADGTGVQLDKGLDGATAEMREDLGLNAFDTTGT